MLRRTHRPNDGTLAGLPVGVAARIVEVDAVDAHRLAVHGLRPGASVVVHGDAPFGGPRIIRHGAARIALARTVARSVRVQSDPPRRPARP
jgi:Fe2+ transport system protein FeoA